LPHPFQWLAGATASAETPRPDELKRMVLWEFQKRVADFSVYADYKSPSEPVNANRTSFVVVTYYHILAFTGGPEHLIYLSNFAALAYHQDRPYFASSRLPDSLTLLAFLIGSSSRFYSFFFLTFLL
jgi:hypothetical protein